MAAIEAEAPDVVVTDIRMPPARDDEGVRVAAELRDTHPEMGVVVSAMYLEPRYALDLLAKGSDGRAYLLKDRVHDRADSPRRSRPTAAGGSVIDAKVVECSSPRARARTPRRSPGSPRASARSSARSPRARATRPSPTSLTLSKRAVEKHINSLFTKLELPESEDVSRRVKAALLFLADEALDRARRGLRGAQRRRPRAAAASRRSRPGTAARP